MITDFFSKLFDTSDFPPRWTCGKWTAAEGWLHIFSDIGIWSAYLAIPVVLIMFTRHRKDLPFRGVFVLFGAFILLCGTTHLMDAMVFWWPAYRLSGLTKLFTALVSWATVVALFSIIPKVLTLRSPEDLEREVAARKVAEEELLRANFVLEKRVQERTAELTNAAIDSNRLAAIVTSSADAIVSKDLNGIVTSWNSGAQQIFGYTAEEMIGASITKLIPIDRQDEEERILSKIRRGERVEHSETLRQTKEGRLIHVSVTASPIKDSSGKVIGASKVARDISERKLTEQALRESDERFRGTFENAAVGIAHVSPEGRWLRVNERLCQITGYTREELLSKTFQDITHGDDLDADLSQLKRLIAGEFESYAMEKRYYRKDGSIMWGNLTVSCSRSAGGDLDYLIAVVMDITDQKLAQEALRENEARLRGILAQSPAGIVQADADGRMTLVNHRWCEMLGYDEAELIGKSVMEVTHSSSRTDTAEAIGCLAAGGPDFQIEKNYERKDGTMLSVQSNVTALRSPTGGFLGLIAVVVDFTERLRIERELREKAHFLQQIAQVTPGVLHVFDIAERRAVFINRSVATLLGYTPGEVAAMGSEVVLKLMHPDDLLPFEQHVARVRELADGVVAAFEHRMRDRAGNWHWFHSHDAVFSRDDAGAARQLIGVATEITERKRAEEGLARLAAIVESSHDALFSEDMDGIITSWNPGAAHIFGYSADEIVGTSILRLIPEDAHVGEHGMQQRIGAGERGGNFEALRLAKDGRLFPASVTIAPLKDAAGKVIGTSRVVRDITERARATAALRASEERMRLATEATGVGIWEWNVLTNSIRWDAQMFRIYGMQPTDDGMIPYETWSSAVFADDLPRQEEVLRDTLVRGGHSTREFRITRANDGEIRIIKSTETVRTNLDGKAEWVVGSNLDVTESRHAAQKLGEAKEAAEAANRSKDRFLAILSHELRTPLTPVLMTVSALEHDTDLRPTVREEMTMIRRNIEMETKLIDDLLDVSRIASGKLELRIEPLDLNGAIQHVCSICRPQVIGQEIELTLDLKPDAGCIAADPARFEQVLWNVLKNAVKFTPRKGRIHIASQRISPTRVEVRITDSGAGIPAEVLPRIFDAFEQGDARITRQFGGLGLGLAISKALIELHGGTIRAESAGVGQGSTFIVEAPGTSLQTAPPQDSAEPPREKSAGLRLLLVEDHADTLRALTVLLSQEGFSITTAGDVASALSIAGKETFDILVSDLGLPDASGYELMTKMKTIQPLIGIAMSGYGMEEDVRQSLAAGFSEHLVKPIKIPQLLAAIQRVLSKADFHR